MSIPDTVQYLAKKKAIFVADKFPNDYIIGADTLCLIDNEVLGKPQNREKAIVMLNKLQGNTHWLYSGQAIVSPKSAKFVFMQKLRILISLKVDIDLFGNACIIILNLV